MLALSRKVQRQKHVWNQSQISCSTFYIEKLNPEEPLRKLKTDPEYQRQLCWDQDQKSAYIGTIFDNSPTPQFLFYKDPVTRITEVIDGQNRSETIREYIEQRPPVGTGHELIAVIQLKTNDEGILVEEHLLYMNKRTRHEMQEFCEATNAIVVRKRKFSCNPPQIYRLMNEDELINFDDYYFNITTITSPMTLSERTDLFMRWQNGTPIVASDKMKNTDTKYTNWFRTTLPQDHLIIVNARSVIYHRNHNFNGVQIIFRLLDATSANLSESRFHWVKSTVILTEAFEQSKYVMKHENFDDHLVILGSLLAKLKSLNLPTTLKFGMVWTLAGIIGEELMNPDVMSAFDDLHFLRLMISTHMLSKDCEFKFSACGNTPECNKFITTFVAWKAMFEGAWAATKDMET